ncbi:MAG: hypothetical protein ACRYFU_02045 [Janthinobacterium lividum]
MSSQQGWSKVAFWGVLAATGSLIALAQTPATPPKPGVPAIHHDITELRAQSTAYPVEGSPDWSVITPGATWVASARANHVVQLKADGTVGLIVAVNRPCAGLTAGFGSIWSPSCRDKKLMRIDPATGTATASVDADPESSEGGIATGAGSVWMVVKPSTLIRVDPATNTITAKVELPKTAADPVFGGGFVWISTFENNTVVKVDPATNAIVATVPTGPRPRFLTFGEGSVWTLNQGDGTVTRIDAASNKVIATIACGIPGEGGDLSYANGYVWAALFDFPLTQIDAKTNQPIRQWAGPGGDGMRAGGGAVWLSNLKQQTVWRIKLPIAQ